MKKQMEDLDLKQQETFGQIIKTKRRLLCKLQSKLLLLALAKVLSARLFILK